MFDDLKEEILSCRKCENKFGFEPHPIVWGNEKSKIMQISQAPSLNVHDTLKPFNDLSGRKLRHEWYDISEDVFYNKDNFYITSVAHCYPGKAPNGGDRLPPKICAKNWLVKELSCIDNEIYIIVCSYAANFLFPGQDYNSLIFHNNSMNGKLAFVLPHPSPLNIKWFRDNPLFLENRIYDIRNEVHKVLKLSPDKSS